MPILKYPRHELFVREYIKNGGNATAAYEKLGAKKITDLNNPKSASVIACIILRRPDVQNRVNELRQQMAKRADITIEKILTDYQLALNLAKDQQKPNDIVNAATAQAKLVGLLRERVEAGQVGDFDGIDSVADILQKVRQEAGAEAAKALMDAFGIEPPTIEESTDLQDIEPPTDAVN